MGQVEKWLHVVAFTLTLLDENQACSVAENHILAVFKQPELYDCLRTSSRAYGSTCQLQSSVLGGDWKFLAMVTGIDAASSNHACISCKCKKDDRGDIQRQYFE